MHRIAPAAIFIFGLHGTCAADCATPYAQIINTNGMEIQGLYERLVFSGDCSTVDIIIRRTLQSNDAAQGALKYCSVTYGMFLKPPRSTVEEMQTQLKSLCKTAIAEKK